MHSSSSGTRAQEFAPSKLIELLHASLAVPLEYAETEVGVREVEDLLGRIEHGVYS